jgi:hypothetical protein
LLYFTPNFSSFQIWRPFLDIWRPSKGSRPLVWEPLWLRFCYWVCQEFRVLRQHDCIRVTFDHFWVKCHFFEAAMAVLICGLSLKPYTSITLILSKSMKRAYLLRSKYFSNWWNKTKYQYMQRLNSGVRYRA